VAVETAVVMPVIILLLLGVWEVGRVVEMQTTLRAAAREGARLAAGGTNSGTPVTVAMVQQAVQNYLQASGFPSAAYSAAQTTVTNLSSDPWTDPGNALPLDPFSVNVIIPAGAPFNSLCWVSSKITGVSQLSATIEWLSANDSLVVVNTQLPY
jgi:Flp pilus assembly protein TadG